MARSPVFGMLQSQPEALGDGQRLARQLRGCTRLCEGTNPRKSAVVVSDQPPHKPH